MDRRAQALGADQRSEDSGLWKSTDGGTTWIELTDAALDNGLPTGVMGKIGIAVSPAEPKRVWALIQAAEPDGGIYRSDDGGGSWERGNRERKLRQRAWYFGHVIAHPTDPDTVFALNTRTYRSIDAGVTWEMVRVPHGDVHDLWINPEHPDRMIVGDDGGAQVTVNGGATWSTYYNQPTAELYDVVVDNAFPYRLYAGQQDNTTIGAPAWHDSNTLYPKMNWVNPGGCETGPVALHPDHPEVTYGGCYGGSISRVDLTAGEYRNILIYPQLQEGMAGRDLKYRFQWVSPILVSRHDPEVVYHASNFVHRTSNGGFDWDTISPDLTRDDPEHQDYSGGPIEHDITGVEIFGTIFSLAESPTDPLELWAGSDDGRVHVTRDGGASWTEVTPADAPRLGTVDEIELSVHAPGRALLAIHGYRLDDFAPYLLRTDDWGSTWALLTDGANGIPSDYPVRTVREDPVVPGLLYAGTEFGVFVSFDDGGSWQPLQSNLPVVPITGMRIQRGDLAVSTQGRSFWILDDLTPLRQMSAEATDAEVRLFEPRTAWRTNMGGASGDYVPEQPPQGATIYYALSEGAAQAASETPLLLEILDANGEVIRVYTSDAETAEQESEPTLPIEAGLNRFAWNLQHRGPRVHEDAAIWGYTAGPKALPGRYTVRLTAGDTVQSQPLGVALDPRITEVTPEQLQQQLELARRLRDRLQQVFDAVRLVRDLTAQAHAAAERSERARQDDLVAGIEELVAELDAIERLLITKDAEETLDLANYEPQLASEYAQVYGYVTGPDGYIAGGRDRQPTAGAYQRFEDLEPRWIELRERLASLLSERVAGLNEQIRAAGVAAIQPRARQ